MFYAMMAGKYLPETTSLEFNWLRIQVGKAESLLNIEPPHPISNEANVYAKAGWVYTDKTGLGKSLSEIVEIVTSELGSWF